MKILRFSALPGTSRHHWGTDLDVYDAGALEVAGVSLQLRPREYAGGGHQASLAEWLDHQVNAGTAEGFFRPYRSAHAGVAPEPWHLSYQPLASVFEGGLSPVDLLPLWRGEESMVELCLREEVEADLESIWSRFVLNSA